MDKTSDYIIADKAIIDKRKLKISDLKRNVTMSHDNMRSVMSVKHELQRSTAIVDNDIITITET